MSDQKSVAIVTSIAEQIETVATEVREQYPVLVKRGETALLHMSKIQAVTTQDEYDKANNLLVKVRKTYDEIKSIRESWTKPLDAFKKQVMEPEKMVSLEASHADSEGNRIKRLMNNFAAAELKRQQDEQRRIKEKQDTDVEIALIEGRVMKNIHEKVTQKIDEIDRSLESFFAKLTLENFDEKSKSIRVKPKLKQDFYESLFVVEYDRSKLKVELFRDEIDRIKANLHYDGVNDIYVEKAQPIIDVWIGKLPERKKQLEELAELAKRDAKKAEEQEKANKAKEEFEAQQRRDKLAADAKQQSDDAEREANIKAQDAVFEAQISTQSVGKMSGVRTKRVAVIDAPEDQIVTVIAKVIYANFTSPGFADYIERDKSGVRIMEDDIPKYVGWLKQILDDHAKLCEVPSDGVSFREVAAATIRKR